MKTEALVHIEKLHDALAISSPLSKVSTTGAYGPHKQLLDFLDGLFRHLTGHGQLVVGHYSKMMISLQAHWGGETP